MMRPCYDSPSGLEPYREYNYCLVILLFFSYIHTRFLASLFKRRAEWAYVLLALTSSMSNISDEGMT
jgi:hypothetical protein